MEVEKFKIDQEDLKTLFIHTRFAYGNMKFNDWVKECKVSYVQFSRDKENPKTFSQWVNGQIIALT